MGRGGLAGLLYFCCCWLGKCLKHARILPYYHTKSGYVKRSENGAMCVLTRRKVACHMRLCTFFAEKVCMKKGENDELMHFFSFEIFFLYFPLSSLLDGTPITRLCVIKTSELSSSFSGPFSIGESFWVKFKGRIRN